jgi:putative protease
MELLVNPASYSNAVDLIKLKVHQINVGTQEFSIRNNCNLTLGELEELVAHKNTTKVFVLVNKFFFEPEIISLEKFLLEICKLNIDGIIFSDMAIPQILFEHHIRTSLIYDPDTLVCN